MTTPIPPKTQDQINVDNSLAQLHKDQTAQEQLYNQLSAAMATMHAMWAAGNVMGAMMYVQLNVFNLVTTSVSSQMLITSDQLDVNNSVLSLVTDSQNDFNTGSSPTGMTTAAANDMSSNLYWLNADCTNGSLDGVLDANNIQSINNSVNSMYTQYGSTPANGALDPNTVQHDTTAWFTQAGSSQPTQITAMNNAFQSSNNALSAQAQSFNNTLSYESNNYNQYLSSWSSINTATTQQNNQMVNNQKAQ